MPPASARAIWSHARDNGFVIVSKDEDFHRLSVIRLLRVRREEVEAFVAHEEAAFLALA